MGVIGHRTISNMCKIIQQHQRPRRGSHALLRVRALRHALRGGASVRADHVGVLLQLGDQEAGDDCRALVRDISDSTVNFGSVVIIPQRQGTFGYSQYTAITRSKDIIHCHPKHPPRPRGSDSPLRPPISSPSQQSLAEQPSEERCSHPPDSTRDRSSAAKENKNNDNNKQCAWC